MVKGKTRERWRRSMNADGPDWHDWRQQNSVQVIENRVQLTIRDPKNLGWESFQSLAYLHESQVRGP